MICTGRWGASRAAFSSRSLASSFSCSQAESTPAPAPQPAGQVRERKPLRASLSNHKNAFKGLEFIDKNDAIPMNSQP